MAPRRKKSIETHALCSPFSNAFIAALGLLVGFFPELLTYIYASSISYTLLSTSYDLGFLLSLAERASRVTEEDEARRANSNEWRESAGRLREERCHTLFYRVTKTGWWKP